MPNSSKRVDISSGLDDFLCKICTYPSLSFTHSFSTKLISTPSCVLIQTVWKHTPIRDKDATRSAASPPTSGSASALPHAHRPCKLPLTRPHLQQSLKHSQHGYLPTVRKRGSTIQPSSRGNKPFLVFNCSNTRTRTAQRTPVATRRNTDTAYLDIWVDQQKALIIKSLQSQQPGSILPIGEVDLLL